MAPDHDPDDDGHPSGPPPPPEQRLWRHPSELGAASGAASAPLHGASGGDTGGGTVAWHLPTARTSNIAVLAGACIASVLVAFGAMMLTRQAPSGDLPRTPLGRGVTVSLDVPDLTGPAGLTGPAPSVPSANAAAPLRRAQVGTVPDLLRSGAGQLQVKVADDDGALVVRVDDGGAADRAGVAVGDVIVAVDRRPVADAASLLAALSPTRPGQKVPLTVRRVGGSPGEVHLEVVLA